MFKKDDDGTYAFSTRFWVSTFIAAFFIIWIGYNTQMARNRTEQIAQETQAYAEQTNDCLKQMLVALNQRAEANRQLDLLVDQRSSVVDRRTAIWTKFITDLNAIPDDLPQADKDRLAKPITDTFLKANDDINTENEKINTERKKALAARAENPYPDPNCTDKLPGE